ncbi:MAG: hypothetical protein M3437_14530 [Chloroflexota bacterium]|nr:hypothetical protein [Chloroflexota bacterium]MDQ5866487.1 hypothetical protein [Chloroflexota bacterium]
MGYDGHQSTLAVQRAGVGLAGRTRFAVIAAGVALSALLSIVLNLAFPTRAFLDESQGTDYPGTGLFDGADHVHGLHDLETAGDGTTYRWTTGRATWQYPYLASLGRHVDVSMRLASWVGRDAPAEVALLLNGKEAATFSATPEFRVYNATLDTAETPNPYLDPAYVQLDLTTSTVSPPGDARQLGVAVDWVSVTSRKSRSEIALDATVWAMSALLLLLVATSRLSLGWAALYGLLGTGTLAALEATAMPRAIPAVAEVALVGLGWTLAAWLAPRRTPAWGLALAACLLWMVVAGRVLGDWQIDDAYISYRYAWNLAHGNGLVYNPGEVVEGYTNFLWTLAASVAIWAGLSPAGVALAGTIACSMGILALTYWLARRLIPDHPAWALLPATLLAVDSALLTYGPRGSGIEAVPFAFLALAPVAALWAAPARGWRLGAGVVLGLAALTRPEGMLVAVLLLGARAWLDRREGLPYRTLLMWSLVPFLAIAVPYQLWRVTFYGYPFPNTFYAKTGTNLAVIGRGAGYAWQFAERHWLPVALALACLVLLAWGWLSGRRTPKEAVSKGDDISPKILDYSLAAVLGLLVLVYAAYVVYVGGDWFPSERFFVPLLAPVALLATAGAYVLVSGVGQVGRRAVSVAVLGVMTVAYAGSALWQQRPGGELADDTHRHNIYIDRWGSAAIWLRENTPPDTWTAARAAGAIAYYSQRPTIDMFGLNDLHIGHLQVANMGEAVPGHEKSDPAYVLARRPSYVLASWEDYFNPVVEQFKREYGYETVRSPLGPEVKWLKRR